jgi:hypothetical protein
MRRIGISMMLEHAFNLRSDHHFLHRITQQIADHPHAIRTGQLDKYCDVRSMIPEHRMGRMPDTLPAEDAAPWVDIGPLGIERVTAVTQPFRPELPSPTMAAALHE